MLTAPFLIRVVLVLGLLAARPVVDAPRFACQAGVTVRRTLEMKGQRELTKRSKHVGDETEDADDFHISIEMSQKLVVDDEYEACAGERVTKLGRTFVTLERWRSETSSNTPKTERPETSDLGGKTVLFTWNGDQKSYVPTIDGEKAPELTADLEADMDYRAFLPEKGAEAGAKWDVDLADVKTALLRPGGDIPFHAANAVKPMDKRLRDAAWDSTKGKLSLELGSPRDEDGQKLVTIAFHGDLSYDAEVEREADEKGPPKLRAEDAQKLEGKLVWDLQAGRARELEWTAKGQMKLTIDAVAKQKEGGEVAYQEVMTFDESYTYTGTFEPK